MAQLDYPWLAQLWRQWLAVKEQQGLPHAIGLAWQPELGSLELLQALVAWLLCQEPKNKACGRCKSCLLHAAGNHPDLLWLAPEEGKKIGVDRIRELQEQVWQHSSQSGATVVVIAQAEQMTEAAANALLKTLEEPPQNNYLLVCPERFSRLLPTIRSRLTVYALPQPSRVEIQDWLKRHGDLVIQDEALLAEAQRQPVTWLKRFSAEPITTEVAVAACRGHLTLPEKLPEQLLWLDELLASLSRGMQTAALSVSVAVRQQQTSEWQNLLLQAPQLSTELFSWYERGLKIKQQLQGSGINGRYLIQPLLSAMYLRYVQIEVE